VRQGHHKDSIAKNTAANLCFKKIIDYNGFDGLT
jgi:hypothetical protein